MLAPLLITVGSFASACGSDARDTGVDASVDSGVPASVGPTTTIVAAATTTTTVLPAAFATPSDAGERLFALWASGNRDATTAEGVLTPADADRLFAVAPDAQAKNRGCDAGEFGTANCFFGNGAGGVNLTLAEVPGGWTITSVEPFA